MSMASFVSGIRDLDGKFAKMMKAKLACEEAGAAYPAEVREYFKCPEESEDTLRRDMESVDINDATSEYSRDATDVFDVDLSKLPEGVKVIRFENSY